MTIAINTPMQLQQGHHPHNATPTTELRTYYKLGSCMRRPKRERLDAALRVALNLSVDRAASIVSNPRTLGTVLRAIPRDVQANARPVWERLLAEGVVPADWESTNARRFVYHAIELEHPAKAHHAIAIASDPHGVTKVETYLRTWKNSACAWKIRTIEQSNTVHWLVEKVWRTVKPRNYDGEAAAALKRAIEQEPSGKSFKVREREIRDQILIGAGFDPNVERSRFSHAYGRMAHDALMVEMWDHAARSGWLVPRDVGRQAHFEGRPFRDLPNPFAPALAVWECGYELRRPEHSSIPVQLVAPAL